MKLAIESAIRVEMRTAATLQKGKYARRSRYYIFACACGREFAARRSEFKKFSGLCRPCAHKKIGKAVSEANKKRVPAFHALYNRLKYNLERIGDSLALTFPEFVEFTTITECHYCQGPILWPQRNLTENGMRYNLDRKDNDLGYRKDNLVVCCWGCNAMKGDRLNYDEMVAAMKAVIRVRTEQGRTGWVSPLRGPGSRPSYAETPDAKMAI